ncbi:MAG: ATPase, T2SS/T4P/T4SS family [Candidatus Aenigmarchaeota archaeon]|nr:ATPase, T2SS/T4P/T4SS family [Candidatus Aenigmarchaeota archaeon]
MEKPEIIESYEMVVDDVPATVKIMHDRAEFVPIYQLVLPEVETATRAALDSIREELIPELKIEPEEIMSAKELKLLKDEFAEKARRLLKKQVTSLSERNQKTLIGILIHNSLGLGKMEILLQDKNLEEIVINDSKSPVWVYHIRLGWLKTNIMIPTETDIYNYAAAIGRRVGTQITNLNPLMDAYLTTGDRANATLFPISSSGNTLTIRKFARRPWTITDFIETGTLSTDVAAFLWLAIQYELNIVVSGGTASGKTSLLNALTCFIPPNQRIISIEDTREIQLPRYLHWVPLTTRPSNPEGMGEVTMLQLMINALRMRPDRVIVGEIRRGKEAQVLFEAVTTGHSVYSTLHANTSDETFRRLVNPPIDIPVALLGSLQLIVVMHRDRRKGIRRVLEIAELIPTAGVKQMGIELNVIFRWIASEDAITELSKSFRAINDIKLYSGMDDNDVKNDLEDKKKVLKWLVKNKVKDIHEVGRVVSEYYRNREELIKIIEKEMEEKAPKRAPAKAQKSKRGRKGK